MSLGAAPAPGTPNAAPKAASASAASPAVRRHHSVATTLCLVVLVSLSFVFHFFSTVFASSVYVLALGVAMAGYVVSKPLSFPRFFACRVFLPLALLAMGYSFWRSSRLITAFADVVTLVLASTLALLPARRPGDYHAAMKVVVVWGFFFAAGVLLSSFARPLFIASLSVFPSAFASILRRVSAVVASGYSTNPGFTAGYISCAILALVATMRSRAAFSLVKLFLFAFLFLALLFTGKRGHVLFLSLSLALCYLLPLRGKQKIARYWNLFLVVLTGTATYFLLEDMLASVPFVGQAVRSVSGFLNGEDVSSGRTNLWRWAIELFHHNPWLGIGWGDYRTTVVGNATLRDELDVHNIFLQLLCENGLVGLCLFALVFVSFWRLTKKLYRFCRNSADPVFSSMVPVLYFSLAYQLFFLLYGITGNTLYDQHYQIMYFMSCGMAVTCRGACIGRAAFLRGRGVPP